MLFPRETDYRAWLAAAGFTDMVTAYVAPGWHRDRRSPYGLAIAGTKPAAGPSPLRLPALRERVALLKGRGNYLCLHRFEQFKSEGGGADAEKRIHLTLIDEWVKHTGTGDRAEVDDALEIAEQVEI